MTFDDALCDGVTDPHSSGIRTSKDFVKVDPWGLDDDVGSRACHLHNTGDTGGAAPEYLHMCQLSVTKQ